MIMKKTIRRLQCKGYGVTITLEVRNRATNSFRFLESPNRYSIFEDRADSTIYIYSIVEEPEDIYSIYYKDRQI